MSVRTQGTRPGMSRSVIIRFRVNQKSRGKSFILNSMKDFRTMSFGVSNGADGFTIHDK